MKEHSYSNTKYTDIRHSYGHILCPSPRPHISVHIRNGIHKSLLASGKKHHLGSNSHYRLINDILSNGNY